MTNWVGKGKRKSDNWEANKMALEKSREDEKRNWNRQERRLRERENMRKNVRKIIFLRADGETMRCDETVSQDEPTRRFFTFSTS